jgi:uncharacterized membrane protein YfcA
MMTDYLQLVVLFLVGIIAGFTNVMAGGGSTLTLPALILMGLDSALANGTNRVAIIIQNAFAILSFRQQKVHQFRKSFRLALFTLPGATLGALLAVRISDAWFQRVLAVVLIGTVLTMLLSRSGDRNHDSGHQEKRSWFIYPVMFGVGFYGGFIQVGVGFLLMASLYHFLRLNLVHVNMHKVFIVLLYMIPALSVFIWTGNVNWGIGLNLAGGNAIG